MKLMCAPLGHDFSSSSSDLDIVLYGYADLQHRGEAGASIVKEVISRSKLQPDARAWDLMSIALAVIATDVGVLRSFLGRVAGQVDRDDVELLVHTLRPGL